MLATLIGEYRLFDYKAFGFDDPHPEMRSIGAAMPHVLLVAEKDTLEEGVVAMRAAYECSSIIQSGQSHYEDTEFLVDALRAAGVARPLVLLAYVDYDPPGWAIISGCLKHLARYGMEVAATGYLVRPQRFTADEIRRHAIRLTAGNASRRGLLRAWMDITHGIGGRPLGLHADLLPVDRAVKAFAEELRALGVQP